MKSGPLRAFIILGVGIAGFCVYALWWPLDRAATGLGNLMDRMVDYAEGLRTP